jgi:hypothetical protein
MKSESVIFFKYLIALDLISNIKVIFILNCLKYKCVYKSNLYKENYDLDFGTPLIIALLDSTVQFTSLC